MKTLKLKVLFASAVVLLVAFGPEAWAIVAGFNQDIHMDIDIPGVVANDFHIEGRIKSGVPGGSFSQPPTLISHIDGGFPNFKHSILPDFSDPEQNSFIFRADFSGETYTYSDIIHLGLFFDVTCHNIVIDLVGWWTIDGRPVSASFEVRTGLLNGGTIPIPGFEVEDRPPEKDPQVVRVRNDSNLSEIAAGGIETEIVQMDLVGMSQEELEVYLGPVPRAFEQLQAGGAQEELPWTPVENKKGIISGKNPVPLSPDSFFDVFLDIDFGTHPSRPFRILPDDFLITRALLRYTNNAGEPDFRWFWHVHQAHPPQDGAFDFGDAPETAYPTLLASNGARHVIVPPMALGFGVDAEVNGQPNATATGDDNDGNDDEDGVFFTTALVPGQPATVAVTATVAGLLDAWIDFDGDGSWAQPGDQVFAAVPLAPFPPTINSLNFTVPPTAAPNITTYARFRFSSAGGLSFAGQAQDGEVEDYAVRIGEIPVLKSPIENLKWSQPPIEVDPKSPTPVYCGWDESSFSMMPSDSTKHQLRKIVADDFRCLGAMPITSVHWWGSYEGWDLFDPPQVRPTSWLIGFWSNVPALPQADPDFSHPQTLLWQFEVSADRVSEEPVGIDNFPDKFSDTCFQYFVDLSPKEYFRQAEYHDVTRDNVFWISIVAVYSDLTFPKFTWGWKTRPWPWMDDAVTFDLEGELEPGFSAPLHTISPLSNSAICGEPEGYDMAFELDTDPNYIKWQQPFTGNRHWPGYEDEESMATGAIGTDAGTKWIQQPDLSNRGLDIDATADFPITWPPVTVADDFVCTTTGPLTDITVWSSFFDDQLPGNGVDSIRFTLSIFRSLSTYPINTGSSTPGELLWTRQFRTGEYGSSIFAENLREGWYAPALEPPNYQPFGDSICRKYDFSIDANDAFIQQGTLDNPVVYWLAVQAFIVHPPGSIATRLGWKTSPDHWNDSAVWVWGEDLPSDFDTDVWNRLRYPSGHPLGGDHIDLAFAVSTQSEQQKGLTIRRLVADDWRCDTETPVTAAAWWGSYIGYGYQACECPNEPPPIKPDYFLLSIWTDVPATSNNPFSHPREKIWECQIFDYDEVLVGYDKHPNGSDDPAKAGYEPVFRYSVQLPEDKWFYQETVDEIYWFSVVAVYTDAEVIKYPWGWTNHEHVFQDDAVAGHVDPSGVWQWEDLHDQTGKSEDMSFVLFTEPR
ncbi:MAG: GEVED domain-containing protein [Sedimentisphaerales bacterium]